MKIDVKLLIGLGVAGAIGYYFWNKSKKKTVSSQTTGKSTPDGKPKNKVELFLADFYAKADANLLKGENDAELLLKSHGLTKEELGAYFKENPKEEEKMMAKIMEALSKTTINVKPVQMFDERRVPIAKPPIISTKPRTTIITSSGVKCPDGQKKEVMPCLVPPCPEICK